MSFGPVVAAEVERGTLSLAAPAPLDFEDLVRRFGPRLLAVARRLLRSEEDARDAVQDGLLAAFRCVDSFQHQSAPETWLHRIVVNSALMKLRARRRKPETSIEEFLPQFLEDGHHQKHVHEWSACPEKQLGQRETQAIVRGCIDRLPEGHRTVLLLRDIEELSTEETAQSLGISEGAVKVRLHRARLALRGLLAGFFEDEQA